MIAHRTERDGKPIGPEPFFERYGAGTVRCYVLFMGPHDHDLDPSDVGQLDGVHRFLGRLWRLSTEMGSQASGIQPTTAHPSGADLQLLRKTHETIENVTETMEGDLRLHVAIAGIMGLVSEAIRLRDQVIAQTLRSSIASAASLLFPFAPHCSADVYHRLTGGRIWEVPWPQADPMYLRPDELEIRVQVNGKLRDRIRVRYDCSQKELKDLARSSPQVRPPRRMRDPQRGGGARQTG